MGTLYMNDWPTKKKDLKVARDIIESYAKSYQLQAQTIGVFEVVTDIHQKKLEWGLSPWVMAMTTYFQNLYGIEQGELVVRKILTLYFVQGQTLH